VSETQSVAVRVLSQVNAGSAYWNCCDRVSLLNVLSRYPSGRVEADGGRRGQ
jgi:hypothetical protein